MSALLLREATFTAIMAELSHRLLGRNEALVLVDLGEDDPAGTQAYVFIGDEAYSIPRAAIKAHGR